MSTTFTEDVAAVLNTVMPAAERKAKAAGRALAATERSEIARLVRESLGGNHEALEALKVFTGAPATPAKPVAPTITETSDLGRLLLETGRHRSPFFAETSPRTVKEITEDAGIPGATPGLADEIGRMPLVNGDQKFHDLTQAWALQVPFGGQRLNG
jgi:hypothetical protein